MNHDLYTCELMDDVILNCTRKNKMYEPYRFFVQGDPKAVLLLELKSDNKNDLDQKLNMLLKDLDRSGNSYARPVLTGDEIHMAMGA